MERNIHVVQSCQVTLDISRSPIESQRGPNNIQGNLDRYGGLEIHPLIAHHCLQHFLITFSEQLLPNVSSSMSGHRGASPPGQVDNHTSHQSKLSWQARTPRGLESWLLQHQADPGG